MDAITRTEKLLDGQDLEPITRKEMFIKRIYDKTQVIPEPVTREEYFLKKAGEGGGGDVTIEQLNVTQNGEYSEQGKAYSPVIVEVPQPSMSTLEVSENGNYDAPSGTGYNRVEVNVPLPSNAYLLKSIPSTPTDIATISDGANLPMPYLKVGVEAWQEGSGDPSPSNVRPIHGWSSVNIVDCGDTSEIEYFANLSKGIYGVVDLGSLNWSYETSLVEGIEVFQATISGMTAGTTTFSCPLYKNVGTRSNLATNDMTMARLNSSSSVVLIRNDSYSSTIAFKTAMSGVKLIYELSEPTAPTVTPSELQAIISSYNVISQIYTIDLDGTRYGGYIEIVNGETRFVGTRAEVDLSTLSWNALSNNRYKANIATLKIAPLRSLALMCDKYKTNIGGSAYDDMTIYNNPNDASVTVVDSSTSTITGQLVYELAESVIIPLGNYPISTLEGENNLFADSGQILDGEYLGGVS